MLSHALRNGPRSLTELERSSASRMKRGRWFECRRRFSGRSAVGARQMLLSTGCSMDAGSWSSIWSRVPRGEPVPCSLALDSGPRTQWTRLWSRRPSSSAAPSLRLGIRRTWGAFRQVFATCECLRFEVYGRLRNAPRRARGAARVPGRDTIGTRSPSSPGFSRRERAESDGLRSRRSEVRILCGAPRQRP